ncbi:lachesin-like isoform X1 [Chelonus insularis]|uniref:lachesin-like isoform X1 n=1 Tax=Chelonus insularis TaxID=460826 RepID=UPI001589178E|nr:lachesin-like isoform X1 [Chelonus insularis]XP_034939897.1 lachesin-like isoform X1 [Chelonus insularis]XP_034939898.1 lachesin-like isoform X1 [Chelonus insularis]XP_034939899.1 lachesin-like isoform X1 [Chelonus insularis]
MCLNKNSLLSNMMLIYFSFIAVFLPSISCLKGPYIYDNSTIGVVVQEGDSPKLECYANDNLSIKWHRDPSHGNKQNLLLPNGNLSCECGNILEIPSITKAQRGRYVCSAENSQGSAVRYMNVVVEFAPVMVETHRIDRIEQKEIELYCEVISYPPPALVWTKNNVQLYASRHYRVITHPTELDDESKTTLIISTESDYNGTYACRIANKLGVLAMTFEVTAPAIKRILVPEAVE